METLQAVVAIRFLYLGRSLPYLGLGLRHSRGRLAKLTKWTKALLETTRYALGRWCLLVRVCSCLSIIYPAGISALFKPKFSPSVIFWSLYSLAPCLPLVRINHSVPSGNGQWLISNNKKVASDEQQRYTEIIDNILATADLETISRKKVRQGLETRLGGKDLSVQKVWPRKDSRCVEACVAVTLFIFVAFVFEIMSQVLSSTVRACTDGAIRRMPSNDSSRHALTRSLAQALVRRLHHPSQTKALTNAPTGSPFTTRLARTRLPPPSR